MERSDWDDDEEYPSAPVPPHERTWRHPSEMAQTDWRTSEPPLAIGRGLMIATGTIGTLLSVVVLWAMLPAAGSAPTAASVSAAGRIGSSTALTDRPVATASAAITASTSRITLPATTVITEPAPAETDPPTPVATVHITSSAITANAVALTGGLLVTTIGAVGDALDVTVDDGLASLAARVLLVDEASGIAVLLPSAASNASEYQIAGCSPGDQVRVLDDQPFDASVTDAGDGRWALASERSAMEVSAMEGTPVVNAGGQLVGLYSNVEGSIRLVRVDHLRQATESSSTTTAAPDSTVANTLATPPSTTAAPSSSAPGGIAQSSSPTTIPATSTTTRAPPVWLGLQVTGTAGGVRIDLVAGDGPAAAAGLQAGDVITDVDGHEVASAADVADQLATKLPGETVIVSYSRNGRPAEITITLAVRPAV